uniref:uncharacterized protein LOC120339570 n=1 Tax=Styela clava TaxID=7725 RepID=UPI00193A3841|nr:uncharacterized protein LOC120339570 [Styela clava]
MMSHRRKNCDQERDVIWNKIAQMETENKEIKNMNKDILVANKEIGDKNKVLEAENKELARQLKIVCASVAQPEESYVGMKVVLERVLCRLESIDEAMAEGFPDFEMCKTLTIRQTQSLDELITVADVCYSIDATHSARCNRASKPMVAVVNNSECDDGGCESEFSKLRNDFKEILDQFRVMLDEGHRPRFSRQKGGRRNEGITCYGCGAEGHICRNCPENQCQRCHGRGHIASQCDRYYVPQNSQPSAYSAQQTASGHVGNFSQGNSSNSVWGGNGQTRDGGNIPQFHPAPKNNDMPLNRNQ